MVQRPKKSQRQVRRRRIRARVMGTSERPRLSVFRSSKHLYVQLIDDAVQRTLVSVSDTEVRLEKGTKPQSIAAAVGAVLAQRAKQEGITKVVFDRGGFSYQGRVEAVAQGARKGGLQF